MSCPEPTNPRKKPGSVAPRRHWRWLCVTACLCSWGLLCASMPGCSIGYTGCAPGRHPGDGIGPCLDSNHYLTCRGGEGAEFEVEEACPTDWPWCEASPDGQNHSCQSHDPLECVSELPDIAGSDLRVADLNGDGLSDLVYVRDNTLIVSLASAAGGFLSELATTTLEGVFRLEHLDGDDRWDLVLLDRGNLRLLFGSGAGSFGAPRSLSLRASRLLGAGDLDGDGVADIILETAAMHYTWLSSARDFAPIELAIEPSTQAGEQSEAREAVVWREPDGVLSLVLGDDSLHVSSFTLSGERWSFQQRAQGSLFAAADFDHDGRLDLALQVDQWLQIRLGPGVGTFERGAQWPGRGLLFADLNNDGELDLQIQRVDGQLSLLGRGDGTFQEGTLLHVNNTFTHLLMTAQGPELLAATPTSWSVLSSSCLSR